MKLGLIVSLNSQTNLLISFPPEKIESELVLVVDHPNEKEAVLLDKFKWQVHYSIVSHC